MRALAGGIAIQHPWAYQANDSSSYGFGAAEATLPVAKMLARASRPRPTTPHASASYNPWIARLARHRQTVGGLANHARQRNCLDRETALRMWTEKVTWFPNEEGKKGPHQVGQLADLIVPDP